MTTTNNPAFDAAPMHDPKKNDDAFEMHLLAERMDQLNIILAASAQGHYRRSLVAADIGNPAPLGFFAFAVSLAMYMVVKAQIVEIGAGFLVIPAGIFVGGLGMLITAIFELFRRNALGYSAFGLYGTFFMATSIYTFGQVRGWFFLPSPKGQQAAAALVGIASFIFMASSAAICVLLPFIFMMLTVTFFLMAASARNEAGNVTKVAGWWGLVTAGFAMYSAAAFLLEDLWGKEVLPIFYTKAYKQHAAQLFPRISHSDPRSVTAGVPYPGRPEFRRGENLQAAAAASLDNLNRLHRGEDTV